MRRWLTGLAGLLTLLVTVSASAQTPTLKVDGRHGVQQGDPLIVRFTGASGSGRDWVGLYDAAETDLRRHRFWRYVHGSRTIEATGPTDGEVSFRTAGLPPGAYRVVLFFDNDYEARAEAAFSIYEAPTPRVSMRLAPADELSRLAPTEPTLVVGQCMDVAFTDANGGVADWIGIFPRGGAGDFSKPLRWLHTNGALRPGPQNGPKHGFVRFQPLNLTPGAYEVRLFGTSTTNLRAAAPVEIISPGVDVVPRAPAGTISVATFNLWVDAKGPGGLDAAALAIIATRPDIVGLQECRPETLATLLGLLQQDEHYAAATASSDAFIISRFPITATYAAPESSPPTGIATTALRCAGVRVRLPDGRALRVFNSHLTPYPYGPYTVRDGGSGDDALADEATTRLAEIDAALTGLIDAPAAEPDLATVLVGDHNCPSALDWTEPAAAQHFDTIIAWPVSTRLFGTGFVDAYRAVHPDPARTPGFTWTPGAPKGTLDPDDVADRIDMVYHRAGRDLRLRPSGAFIYDRDPYPSDHRMVIVHFGAAAADRPQRR